jgi:GTP-binding protein HflX
LNERADRHEQPLIEDRLGARARVYGSENAILVAVERPQKPVADSLRELEALADTAGVTTLAVLTQKRLRRDASTFIGKGKVSEVKAAASELGADVIICNDELSPAQARNLEKAIERKVIDRSQLIMDIFAQRAATKEARLQVELAQLRYLLPRLRGWGSALTRLGGGIGTRGPGETQLELDRKKINRQIHTLERRLTKARSERDLRRKRRTAGPLPQVVLIGYTNSGKSTLLNRLCDTDLLVEDKLFATLSTTVRRGELATEEWALFTDTVGFIRDLPHHLIPAFASTLEAVRDADLILHIIDISSHSYEEDYHSVLATLNKEVFSNDEPRPPILNVLNKIDLLRSTEGIPSFDDGVRISAKNGIHLDALKERIRALFNEGKVRTSLIVPYDLQRLSRLQGVTISGYTQDGIEIEACLSPDDLLWLQRAGARIRTASSPRGRVSH